MVLPLGLDSSDCGSYTILVRGQGKWALWQFSMDSEKIDSANPYLNASSLSCQL
jgi:hypothetical protein